MPAPTIRTPEQILADEIRQEDANAALREPAENALATLDNMLAHYGNLMPEADRIGRKRVADALRRALQPATPEMIGGLTREEYERRKKMCGFR
ncbi:MAG: hypothetical protein K0R61_30 [Microvirga sp.]|jgi:hypothetical protein|nr:hypothetical protein [Microvirga sp.]MDF2969580.1 hypothetical protein [Microvirga sp.]